MTETKLRSNEWRIPTDENHLIKVDSYLIFADWQKRNTFAGQAAPFVIKTAFVGHGATAKIKGMSEQGQDLGERDAYVLNDQIIGSFAIPEDMSPGDQIYFSVTFDFNVIYPPNNPGGFSSTIPVLLMPQVPHLAWSKQRAHAGEGVFLEATLSDIPSGTPAALRIYRVIETGTYDCVTQFETTVTNGTIAKKWQCGGDLDRFQSVTRALAQKHGLPHESPCYIFTVIVGDKEYGKADEASNRLSVFLRPRYRYSI